MDATQPLAQDLTRLVGPFDLASSTAHQDFLYWWRRGAKLLRLPQLQPRQDRHWEVPEIEDAQLPRMLKALHALDEPRQALLLTMLGLAGFKRSAWLHQEAGLEFGQLAACRLGHDVFQVMVGLLANHRETPNH
ncbi:TPA: hypothetical protein L4G57_000550 [Pseudomonas aeruginosa]|uniref:hypothetical protein n=1 Tax=Pseudomonas aeruginosa TaxID=287 RepID=UPI000E3156C1|nr:hypothetical protein [Pseudomonas aeruginosa]NQD30177.1 hypothetical protein [Pseudomonas aeruginosa]RPM95535.1 hypothetical protein IPC1284_26465 [Pseudomonas aeruginosa]RTV48609.1 hypothetical protein DY989_26810 [Pseudomonas aeruginosa]HBO2066917.1 hypothetical protein [Pseudomonas aeruginosa]HCF3382803.1 hypothetical protein [Pseudomonas aeruginosa]